MNEILFVVEEADDGSYRARAVGAAIHPEAGSLEWGSPGFREKSTGITPSPPECPSMTNPTKTSRRFTAPQKQEASELCRQEGISCNAVAQRLALPSSSLACWVRQARIERGPAPQ